MVKIFIQNATLLIALSFIYAAIRWYKPNNDLSFKIYSGILFGFVAIAAMMMPYEFYPGIFYDGRSVILTLVGFWLGGYSVFISAIIASIYRLYIGGAGVWAGVATIFFCSIIGLFFYVIYKEKLHQLKFYILVLIGFVSHLIMLGSQLLLPQKEVFTILKHIWIPVIIVFPLAFAIIAFLFQILEKYFANDRILKEAEELYRTTLFSIGDAVICTDKHGKINQMNKVAESLTGWLFKEAKDKKLEEVFKIISEIDRQKVKNPVDEVLEKGVIVGLANHTLLITKNGYEIPIADSGAPIVSNNEIIGVVLVFRDQTEEREQKKKLISSEAKYREREYWLRESQRVGRIGTYNIDIENDKWTGSEVMDEIFGISKDETHNLSTWIDLIHPNHKEEVKAYFTSIIKENKRFEKSYKIIRRNDGAERWVSNTGEVQFNENGKGVRMFGTISDITDRNNYELQLEESERSFRKLFENHSAVKLLINPETAEIVKANQAAADFYGWTIDELESMKVSDISIDSEEAVNREVKNSILNERVHYEFKHRLKNGNIRDIEIFTSKTDYKGSVLLHSIVHDITERNLLLNNLVEAKERAEEGERLKTAFLANMSHEIRTPLNGIIGFTNILVEDDDLSKDKKQEYAQIIHKSTTGLLKIINDILDISRLETGKNVIEYNAFDVDKMLLTVYNVFSNKLDDKASKSIQFQIKKPDQPISIISDENRLIQVFSNLIENAFKFTSQGVISFGVYNITDTQIEFFVSDTGIGIPKEKQQLIFDRFAQAENGFARSYGGSGLGLAIVRKLIELMDGEIHIESEVGIGTRFKFTLPVVNAKGEKITDNQAEVIEHKLAFKTSAKILIVEDDSVSRLYLESILEPHFSRIFFADSGAQALQLFESEFPDIILMDIGLPDINGLDVVRKIRETNTKVKIVAQTAYAMAGDRNNSIAAGCNEYLSKPVKANLLLQTLKKCIDN